MKLSRIQFSFEVGCSTSTASGGWRETVLKNRIPIINLSIEEIIGDIPAAYVELAVDAARRALPISSLSNSNSSKPLNTVFFNRQDQKSSTLEPKRLISRKRAEWGLWGVFEVV